MWQRVLKLFAMLTVSLTAHAASLEQTHSASAVLLAFWSNNEVRYPNDPMPGSRNPTGALENNSALRGKLNAVNVLAYAFLSVDDAGHVYFSRPAIDLSSHDARHFCRTQPESCPGVNAAKAGNFAAFAKLNNSAGTLRKIISVGGADSQKVFDNAVSHPDDFVRSASSMIQAYRLDGIDLDFEPDSFFTIHDAQAYAQLVAALRKALGPQAFISVEVPGDRETLRSMNCPTSDTCHDNLHVIAANAYISLMGYDFHSPFYPGPVTGNDSNLYSSTDEPLLRGFYHSSDNQAVEYLTYQGVSTDRIILGFPAYFVAYGGVQDASGSDGLFQPFDRSMTPLFDWDIKGRGSYSMAQHLLRTGFTPQYMRVDNEISAVYAYNPVAKQWISYEDPSSVTAKAHYVKTRHLAGMAMWEIGQDVSANDPQSLLRAAHDSLLEPKPNP
jgi:GH18 family chitinase